MNRWVDSTCCRGMLVKSVRLSTTTCSLQPITLTKWMTSEVQTHGIIGYTSWDNGFNHKPLYSCRGVTGGFRGNPFYASSCVKKPSKNAFLGLELPQTAQSLFIAYCMLHARLTRKQDFSPWQQSHMLMQRVSSFKLATSLFWICYFICIFGFIAETFMT